MDLTREFLYDYETKVLNIDNKSLFDSLAIETAYNINQRKNQWDDAHNQIGQVEFGVTFGNPEHALWSEAKTILVDKT